MRLGVNPSWNAYYMPNEVWLDLLRSASDWVSRKVTDPYTLDWGASHGGPGLDLSADGNVLSLAADQYVQCALKAQSIGRKDFSVAGSRLVLYYTGTGTWEIAGGGATYALISNDTSSNPKRAVLSLTAPSSSATPFFRLLTVDALDPIKVFAADGSLGLIEEQYEAQFLAGQKWHPEYLAMNDFVTDIRFQNPQNINDSDQVDWADRRVQNYRSQTSGGGWPNSALDVPLPMTSYEEMIELANYTGWRPWFHIPHQATDDYVTQLATLIKANLDPALKVRFEYSNECWNSIFPQYDYCEEQGLLIWTDQGATPWVAARRYYSYRAGQVMDLIDAVFTGDDAARLLKVAAWQATDPTNGALILDYTDATVTTALKNKVDRIACAPYIGGDMGTNPQAVAGPAVAPYDKVTVDMTEAEIIGWMRGEGNRGMTVMMGHLASYRALADARGLGLDCYECGQHLVNGPGLSNNSTLTALLNSTNVHADMEDLYFDYFVAISAHLTGEDDVANPLSDTYPPGYTGDWGWRRTQTTTPYPPKERGIRSFYASQRGAGRRRIHPAIALLASGALRSHRTRR